VENAPFWLEDDEAAGMELPKAEGPLEADVAIIGAGITGLSAACHLKGRFPDLDVVVLERERVGFGASGRSSGALTDIPEHKWAYKLAHHGEEETPGYLMVGRKRHVPELRAEAEAMQRLGKEGRLLGQDELRQVLSQDFYEAGVSAPARWLNPGRYVLGLARLAKQRGARIFERSSVREVDRGRTMRLRLSTGSEVKAGTVVLATNGYTSKLGFLRHRVFPLHTCSVATEPLSPSQLDSLGWEGRQIVFEAGQTGHTLYLTPDDRLVCRGTTHYSFNDGVEPFDLAEVETRLAGAIRERFPQLGSVSISHRWSGVLGMTRNFYPAIGRLEGKGDMLYGAGYSGHGIAGASLAGRLIAEMHADEVSTELSYTLEHSVPPLMPPEPLRFLAVRSLTWWWQRHER
jgi:gamma-glutamylputrescine oxidase